MCVGTHREAKAEATGADAKRLKTLSPSRSLVARFGVSGLGYRDVRVRDVRV